MLIPSPPRLLLSPRRSRACLNAASADLNFARAFARSKSESLLTRRRLSKVRFPKPMVGRRPVRLDLGRAQRNGQHCRLGNEVRIRWLFDLSTSDLYRQAVDKRADQPRHLRNFLPCAPPSAACLNSPMVANSRRPDVSIQDKSIHLSGRTESLGNPADPPNAAARLRSPPRLAKAGNSSNLRSEGLGEDLVDGAIAVGFNSVDLVAVDETPFALNREELKVRPRRLRSS